MAVWIAKLERAYTAVLLRQGLRSVEGNRLYTGRANAGIGRIYIRYDDGKVLEPQIGAPAVCRVGAPGAFELRELDLLIAELHRQHIHRVVRQGEQGVQRR